MKYELLLKKYNKLFSKDNISNEDEMYQFNKDFERMLTLDSYNPKDFEGVYMQFGIGGNNQRFRGYTLSLSRGTMFNALTAYKLNPDLYFSSITLDKLIRIIYTFYLNLYGTEIKLVLSDKRAVR